MPQSASKAQSSGERSGRDITISLVSFSSALHFRLAACEKRLSRANVACLQCSVHAAGHRSGLSSICEAWEDSLLG